MEKAQKNQRTKRDFVRGRVQNKVCTLVTKEMTISEVLRKYPKTISIFIGYGLPCLGCPIASGETIEEAAKLHQIDLKKLLKNLNKIAEKI